MTTVTINMFICLNTHICACSDQYWGFQKWPMMMIQHEGNKRNQSHCKFHTCKRLNCTHTEDYCWFLCVIYFCVNFLLNYPLSSKNRMWQFTLFIQLYNFLDHNVSEHKENRLGKPMLGSLAYLVSTLVAYGSYIF
jgi:hypothetical protein